jgi:hypothetical protein
VALIGAHVAICLLLGSVLLIMTDGQRSNPTFLLFSVCVVVMGPLGPLGITLTIVLRVLFARRATPFEEWYEALFPKITATRTQNLYKQIVLQGGGPPKHSTVAPFVDVVALGTVEQKRAVIAMIADGFDPAFASALRKALNDPEPAIRVQAATAAARIETHFLERSMAMQSMRAERPNDADLLLQLARHHEAYAMSGILDEGRAQTELNDALACCERLELMQVGDPIVAETAGRLLLLLDRPDEALERLTPLIGHPDAAPGALASYFGCLFRCGHFERLREAYRLLEGRIDVAALPHTAGEALRLWADDAAPSGCSA